MDFTLKTYKRLLESFLSSGYALITYEHYCKEKPEGKFLIVRHDVDEIAANALKMAEIEYQLGVKATYYFRIVKQSNRPDIIKAIVGLGHEIGYHYEDLTFAQGDLQQARQRFEVNLAYFRRFYPVRTVCVHGSSTSEYDNRDFWKIFALKDFDLIGEPYLTTDFNNVFYFTDTGYAWDGSKYIVRDVVDSSFNLSFHTSDEIVAAVRKGDFPAQCLMLAHTLWTDDPVLWTALHLREFLRNNLKYIAMRNQWVNRIYRKMVKAYWRI